MYAPVVGFYNYILGEINIAPALQGVSVMACDHKCRVFLVRQPGP